MDQRIEKTYTDLQQSMRDLLQDYTWDQISVQKLCDSAGVSRSTFYSHFKNKDDLLDSLLNLFEQAMRTINNARSLQQTGTLKFLPILLNHVRENRQLFSKNNTHAEGYPVAIRFKNLITRLVDFELEQAYGSDRPDAVTVQYMSGGIYTALVFWATHSEDAMHLKLLQNLDQHNNRLLAEYLS